MGVLLNKYRKAVRQLYPKADIRGIYRFKHGLENRTLHIRTSNPKKDLILRIYSNEEWKAEKERYLHNLIKIKTDIPVANVLLIDKRKKILQKPYAILEMIKGHGLDEEFKKFGFSKALSIKAGEILAKIHSIKFPYYGWIIGTHVEPKFSCWTDFVRYMVEQKLKDIRKVDRSLSYDIADYIFSNLNRLDTSSRPCLIHKDYHFPHILIHNHKISGIIDFEWAISGHKEFDFAKPKMWMFKKYPEMEKYFFEGYNKSGAVSKRYGARVNIYQVVSFLSLVAFAYHRNKHLCNQYISTVRVLIQQ